MAPSTSLRTGAKMQTEGKMQTAAYRRCYFHYRFLTGKRVIQANRSESLATANIVKRQRIIFNKYWKKWTTMGCSGSFAVHFGDHFKSGDHSRWALQNSASNYKTDVRLQSKFYFYRILHHQEHSATSNLFQKWLQLVYFYKSSFENFNIYGKETIKSWKLTWT